MFRSLATTVALLAALAFAGAAPAAAQSGTGSFPSAANTCSNPRLAQNATGWSVRTGGSGSRQAITGHVAATFAYRLTAFGSLATINLPQRVVKAGERATFAFDTQISAGGRVRAAVDWYNSTGKKLSHSDGPLVNVTATTWTRVAAVLTVPAGATRALVTGYAQLTRNARWSSTACDYTVAATTPPPTTTTPPPTTTTPPPTTTTTTVPPTTTTTTTTPPTTTTVPPTTTPPTTTPPPQVGPGDGTQAATVLGWTQRIDGDEFEAATLDPKTWYLYDGVGHAGQGVRSPAQVTVANGVLTLAGTATGTTGGMSMERGYMYGRWEARMQVPRGDSRYHPVLILWPDAENFPVGGEIDYAETTTAAVDVDFFLHYSAQNRTTTASKVLDLAEWHNYAVEWTPTGIRGYIDGVQFFSDTDTTHLPPGAMHQTIQLDWFPNGTTATTPSSMNVAWVRIYAL